MEYNIENHLESRIISLRGAFTFNDNAAFRSIIKSLEESPPPSVVLDFAHVGFIDSAALGMLLLLREEQQKNISHIVLRHAQGQVRKMFDLSKFDNLFIMEQ
jgi:anti-anti-sigma factor